MDNFIRTYGGSCSSQASMRINKEYGALLDSKEFSKIKIDYENGSNIYVWIVRIDLSTYHLSDRLKRDFDMYASRYGKPKEVKFEIRFSSNYPNDPPFVRIISPRFTFRTGHVTIGGSICTEGLTKNGWNAQRTIENILVEIFLNVEVGNGSLDIHGSSYDYQLSEALNAFQRSLSVHGWRF